MEQYGRAEEALLQQARVDYREFKASTAPERCGADAMTSQPSMDEWIVETSPCPVPNGAAGLHLLANICRRSNRKQRAMQYYRLALKVCLAITRYGQCIASFNSSSGKLTLWSLPHSDAFSVGSFNVDKL